MSRQVQKSYWQASPYYNEVAAAQYWGVRPSEMGLCDREDDPAVMIAYFQTVKAMEGYEQTLQNRKTEKLNAKPPKRPRVKR